MRDEGQVTAALHREQERIGRMPPFCNQAGRQKPVKCKKSNRRSGRGMQQGMFRVATAGTGVCRGVCVWCVQVGDNTGPAMELRRRRAGAERAAGVARKARDSPKAQAESAGRVAVACQWYGSARKKKPGRWHVAPVRAKRGARVVRRQRTQARTGMLNQ